MKSFKCAKVRYLYLLHNYYSCHGLNPQFNRGQINYGQFNGRLYDQRFSAGLLNPELSNPGRFNAGNNFLSYEGPNVHEDQGKRTEAKNENLVHKTNEIQSAIQEENNSAEKTSKFDCLNLASFTNIQICINLIVFLNFPRFA